MNPLINPNVAYVLLVLGFITGVLALFSPGTGLLEIGAIFALVLAAYSIVNQPFNVWAFGILVIGFVPFIISLRLRKPRYRWILLMTALVAYLLGSTFLFTDANGRPVINFWMILITAVFNIGLAWLLARKSIEAISVQPAFDLDRLIGMQAQTSSDLNPLGTVIINSENWTAHSKTFIPAGSPVRILARNGLTLEVMPETEKVNHTQPTE